MTGNRGVPGRGAVLWVNGPFGVGKSTVAACVADRIEGACLFNPEDVGGLLRHSLGDIADYRVWPEWRRLVVAFIDELARTHRWVVVPMCVSARNQWAEIADAIAMVGVRLAAAVLVGDESALIERIRGSDVENKTKHFRWPGSTTNWVRSRRNSARWSTRLAGRRRRCATRCSPSHAR